MRRFALPFVTLLLGLPACEAEVREPVAAEDGDRGPIGKADLIGSCATDDDGPDFCGGPSDGNCWCDDSCEQYGDCCSDKPAVCGGEAPSSCADGTVVTSVEYTEASDGLACASETEHCITDDWGACPQLAPLPPDFCEDGEIVHGEPSYLTAADGMECEMPSIHCVTRDWDACPLFQPVPPDYCSDGVLETGPDSFVPSADGMECQIPSVHCLSPDAEACEAPAFCDEGTVVTELTFEDAGDLSCTEEVQHCVTDDGFACPQLQPLPPDFCEEGDVVAGAPSFIGSADGMECEMPSVHCVTRDWDACPQLQPLPPDFCEDGQILQGESSFIASADGMECEMPSVHCVSLDAPACE